MAVKKDYARNISGGDAFNVTLVVPGDLATGDGQAQWVVPFDITIEHAQMFISSNGDTSGNTDIMLSIGATDLHAATSARLAHDSSVLYKVITLTTDEADAGDLLEVDIDAIPGGTTSTDLTVSLFCERRMERTG